MAKKRPRGRPPLPNGVAREGRLYCRVSDSETAEIEAAAKKAEKSKSEWMREVLLTAARA